MGVALYSSSLFIMQWESDLLCSRQLWQCWSTSRPALCMNMFCALKTSYAYLSTFKKRFHSCQLFAKTPFTPTHGCCGSERMLYPPRSTQDPYCVCGLPLWSVPIWKKISYTVFICNSHTYYYLVTTHSLFHFRLKTFLFRKSFPLQPFISS